MAVPVGTDVCYPEGADWLCAYSQEELDAMVADAPTLAVMQRSEALAWSTLAALTGYRLSICPVSIRPCLARCGFGGTWDVAPVGNSGTLQPFISGGNWYNACGCRDDCSCTSLCEVLLPMGAGDINYISLGGVTLDPTAYRIDNGYRLVRTDGDCWPTCQDMTLAADAEGSFLVSYYPGVSPNDLFRYAAGVLAVEFYRACEGQECRLPSGVESISRQGVTITLTAGSFPGGMTGIPEVDAVIRVYNPFAMKSPPRILSPDRRRGRVQTWES